MGVACGVGDDLLHAAQQRVRLQPLVTQHVEHRRLGIDGIDVARGADGEISDLCWSPDSAWLAYSDPIESGLTRIMMARLADDINNIVGSFRH